MQSVIGDEKYDIDKISTWCTEISTKVIEYLQSVLPQYRFGCIYCIFLIAHSKHCNCSETWKPSQSLILLL